MGKGPARCCPRGAKGDMRGSGADTGRSTPWGRSGRRMGPASGNANTWDCGSGNPFIGLKPPIYFELYF